jgi:hypothetical protein
LCVVLAWLVTRLFWEGNFGLRKMRKDRKGSFCFRKVEALVAIIAPLLAQK